MKYKAFEPIEYNIDHEDCWIRFHCPKCSTILLIDSQNEHIKCSCGKMYKVSAILYHVEEGNN